MLKLVIDLIKCEKAAAGIEHSIIVSAAALLIVAVAPSGTSRSLEIVGQLCWPSSCDCVGRGFVHGILNRRGLRRLSLATS